MMEFRVFFTGLAKDLLCTGVLLLMIVQLYVLMKAVVQKRKAAFLLVAALATTAHFCFFVLLFDGIYLAQYTGTPRTYPLPVTDLYDLPAVAVIGIFVLLAAVAVYLFLDCRKYEKEHLLVSSIKEAVDLLPVAICFGDSEGKVVLSNAKMNEYCQKLTGSGLYRTDEWWQTVCALGEEQGGDLLVLAQDNTALLFETSAVRLGDKDFTQIVASDFSSRYRITAGLKEHHRQLTDIQKRIRLMTIEQNELVMNEEILKARIALHDEVGYLLLRSRYYFENPSMSDVEAIFELTARTNTLLLSEAENLDNADSDLIAYAVKLAESIGVRVTMNGCVPPNAQQFVALAIKECAANTVKHAGGDTLTVDIQNAHDGFICEIRNNGKPPKSAVVPKGGLLSLQKTAEQQGAAMLIESEPEFGLIIKS